jgi:hypothetical protein
MFLSFIYLIISSFVCIGFATFIIVSKPIGLDNAGTIVFFSIVTVSHIYFSYYRINELREILEINKRINFINSYQLPIAVINKFYNHYPKLTPIQISQAVLGLKVYLIICLKNETYTFVPSKVVDTLWHEFILDRDEYKNFCTNAFGNFLPHIPPYDQILISQASLKTIWRASCNKEKINNSTKPSRLPLLFAIDSQLDIPNGRNYKLEEAARDWGYKAGIYEGPLVGGGDGGGGGAG